MAMAVYEEKEKGLDDTEIMDVLGVDPEDYQEVLTLMFATKGEEVRRKTTEEHYVSYCLEQRKCIKDIDELTKNLNEKTQYNAIVGALRLRSDILDKMVERGQEFGLIAKVAEKRQVTHGIVLADLSDKDLKKKIAEQAADMSDLIKRFGDGKIESLPKRDLYYGEGTIETEAEEVDEEEAPKPKPLPAKKKIKTLRREVHH